MKLKELEKRLKSEPDNLGLRVQVAGLMRESGRSIEAVELYRSVALAYRDQGRTQQAIAVCRSILEIAPDDAACQGLITMLQGRGTPSRPPPYAPEPSPPIAPAVRAPTAGTAPGPTAGMAPGAPTAPVRPASAITPVHITEPIDVPSVPHLRPPTTPHPAQPEPLPDPKAAPATTPGAPRRSSLDETPLPRPVPYHVHDPTSQPHKISARELEKSSSSPNVTSRTGGLAEAARRISGLITAKESVPGIPNKEMDLAAELDTRQRPKINAEELKKLAPPPSDPDETVPRDIADRFHDVQTHNPALDDDFATDQVEALTPPPRGSGRLTDVDLDAITPPPLLGVVPPDVIVPPRTTALPTRPPKRVSIPPLGSGKHSRDSDDELTVPRDKPSLDDDDDE